ncbi:hypothetical protein C2857_005585 [Epichloe festucae Fl1]|uniref:F-box domain-containing protein n=1 Tax=Epichloe festucae (strain Fl1) TaxID=877507 RepID=A0A7S9PU82_EPIFF|nr:hypothetical protein C2857_005585 [Epichloe festucae Fl1]
MANTLPTALPGTCLVQKFPLEVLLRISYYLPTPDLGRLRLTSRSIEQSLYTTFVNEFFTRKQFMITQESLQALIDISKSRLSQHLRFVHIGLDCLSSDRTRLSDEEKEDRFRKRCANNFALWYTGHHRDMMVEAFRNLKNLEDVVIRDFNMRHRSRDGPDAEWHSYGYTTVFNETGVKMTHNGSTMWDAGFPYRYPSQVFAAVIYALGIAQARPRGIKVMSTRPKGLRDFAFSIPDFLQPSVVPLLEGLEKLHLCIDLEWRCLNMGHDELIYWFESAPHLFIRKFLSHTTNLKSLSINETTLCEFVGLPVFLDWVVGDLDSQASTDRTKQGDVVISLPRLEKLSLGTMRIDAPRLLKIVRKFAPSLKSLKLWKVNMIGGQETQPEPESQEIYWDSFLEKLTEIPGLDLKHFKVSMLKQCWCGRYDSIPISFRGYGAVCEYVGSDWKRFIGEIRPLSHLKWLEDKDTTDDEEGSRMPDDEDDSTGDDE